MWPLQQSWVDVRVDIQSTPKRWTRGLGRFMLVFLLLLALGLEDVVFQLSGFYRTLGPET